MRRFHLTVLVLTLGVFLTAVPVSAVSVSGGFNTSVVDLNDKDFVDIFSSAAELSVSDSEWSFTNDEFGTLNSATYKATLGGIDFFAYVYQVINDGDSAGPITGLTISPVFEINDSLDFGTASKVASGGDPVFVISTDCTNVPTGCTDAEVGSTGLESPLSTVFDDGFGGTDIARLGGIPTPQLSVRDFTVLFAGGLAAGAESFLFGFISTMPPEFTTAVVLDGVAVDLEATIVTTSPEPATVLLLGSGLLGLLGIRRRRRTA